MTARVAALILTATALAGCAAPAGSEADPFRYGLWPLYGGDARSWAGVRESRAAGPLLAWESTPALDSFALRPLLSTEREAGASRWDLLYPLAARRETGERSTAWLLLLGAARRDAASARSELLLGPVFRGRTADGRRYGGLFPLAGRFLGRLGFDRIDFALWPLFARGWRGDYRETQLLWPFFAWGSGGGRSKLRLWPLYGVERVEGVSERRFYLWPFVHRFHERQDGARPSRGWYVLPLYGRRSAGSWQMRFVLFPLYARQWDTAQPGVGRLDLLWPLFSRSTEGGGYGLLAVRPLFSRYRRHGESSVRALLGLVGRTTSRGQAHDERWWRLLWAGRIGRRVDAAGSREWREVWPLFRSQRRSTTGGVEAGFLRIPYLLPLRALEPDRYDRHWNKLFEIYSSRWLGQEARSSWLWGLRESRRAPGLRWVSWAGWLHLSRDWRQARAGGAAAQARASDGAD